MRIIFAIATLVALPLFAANKKPNLIVLHCDDLGYADVACQGQRTDLYTPRLDQLAAEGIRCTAGYATSAQCSPSRAGLITGRYQQRIGIDSIPDMPLPLEAVTIAEMLLPAGYATGQVGKWHLDPNPTCNKWIHQTLTKENLQGMDFKDIPAAVKLSYYPHGQGFTEYFTGELDSYYANYDLNGNSHEPSQVNQKGSRVDIQTDAALAFINRNKDKPFFLYLNWYAPHTPLELAEPYVKRFTGDMPERRRAALSMIAGIDHGTGRILDLLKQVGLDENTMVVFTSDNGAPIHKLRDSPLDKDPGGWDGSYNTPWLGEKGMLAEGGIRVPFLVRWKGKLPAGKVFTKPVSTLDIAPTALKLAELPADPKLDGFDLVSMLSVPEEEVPTRVLHWRFWQQIAIREGKWKYLRLSNKAEFLFDLESPEHERKNLVTENPDIVARLKASSNAWAAELQPIGPPTKNPTHQRLF